MNKLFKLFIMLFSVAMLYLPITTPVYGITFSGYIADVNWYFRGTPFTSDSSRLTPKMKETLQPLIKRLNTIPNTRVFIRTHTDNRNSLEYNQQLSDARASAIRDYLISYGIAPSRVLAKGYGETLPIADNTTAKGRFANRRVEIFSPAVNPPTS